MRLVMSGRRIFDIVKREHIGELGNLVPATSGGVTALLIRCVRQANGLGPKGSSRNGLSDQFVAGRGSWPAMAMGACLHATDIDHESDQVP